MPTLDWIGKEAVVDHHRHVPYHLLRCDEKLSADEAREVMNMARRLAAIVLLQPALDDNYRRAAASAYAWPGQGA